MVVPLMPHRVKSASGHEHPVEAKQLEDAEGLVLETGDRDRSTVGADPLVEADQRADSGAVDEPEGGQVDGDLAALFLDQPVDGGPDLGRGDRVEDTLDAQDGRVGVVGTGERHAGLSMLEKRLVMERTLGTPAL